MNVLSRRRAGLAALVFALLLALPGLAAAGSPDGGLTVSQAWARASAGMTANGAVFLTIANHGTAADRLVGVSSPVCDSAQLHTHLMTNGVMRMRPVDGIDVPAGGTVELKPGGLHVMLLGLKAPLTMGESFPLTLNFAKAGAVTAEVKVLSVGAMGMAGGGAMPGMHGH